jgi:hypothetical protein
LSVYRPSYKYKKRFKRHNFISFYTISSLSLPKKWVPPSPRPFHQEFPFPPPPINKFPLNPLPPPHPRTMCTRQPAATTSFKLENFCKTPSRRHCVLGTRQPAATTSFKFGVMPWVRSNSSAVPDCRIKKKKLILTKSSFFM